MGQGLKRYISATLEVAKSSYDFCNTPCLRDMFWYDNLSISGSLIVFFLAFILTPSKSKNTRLGTCTGA